MRINQIILEQKRQKEMVAPYEQLFEATAAVYWNGIYKINTLPLSESAAKNELISLQTMIYETAIQLPMQVIPAFSKYLDNAILQEGFWDNVGKVIDNADAAIKKGKAAMDKAAVSLVKGAGAVVSAGAGLASDLVKKVSPELYASIAKFGKDAKDFILSKLTDMASALSKKLESLKAKISKMLGNTCQGKQAMADSLNISIAQFDKMLREAEEETEDSTDILAIAEEVIKTSPGLAVANQLVNAIGLAKKRGNKITGADALEIAKVVIGGSSDGKLKSILGDESKIVDFFAQNDIQNKVKAYVPPADEEPVEELSADDISPAECDALNKPSIIEQLVAKVPEDSAFKAIAEQYGASIDSAIGAFKSAFAKEKTNIILGVVTAAISLFTGSAPINIAISVAGALVPALIRLLAEYFDAQGMEKAALVTHRVAKLVSILTTIVQSLNLASLVKKMITGEEIGFVKDAKDAFNDKFASATDTASAATDAAKETVANAGQATEIMAHMGSDGQNAIALAVDAADVATASKIAENTLVEMGAHFGSAGLAKIDPNKFAQMIVKNMENPSWYDALGMGKSKLDYFKAAAEEVARQLGNNAEYVDGVAQVPAAILKAA